MTICSVKFWEKSPEFHKYKGRVCFRGDCVKDQEGAPAVHAELAASPTSIAAANSNIAYGLIPGNKTTQADAIRAYIQSTLRSKHKTWVRIPKQLWPKEWAGRYVAPMCVLNRALYGHPEAGGHWEEHLTQALKALGGVPVPNHPSSFWFEKDRLMLIVYVDDLLLSGPAAKHEAFWAKLAKDIDIEPPEPLDRFLGRHHKLSADGCACVLNMVDYVHQTVDMFKQHAPQHALKRVTTPFCPEGSLPAEGEDARGELSGSACALLMKHLWLARLARPDLQRAICALASHVSKWSANDDRRLHRLVCYLFSTPDLKLEGHVRDKPEDLTIDLWVDADFAGAEDDAKSTSGAYLALVGPRSFMPLMWASKRQTSTSRSTTESEVVSLAAALFAEAIPTLDLWDILLGRPMRCRIWEDNQATIRVVEKGYSPKLRHILRTHKVNLSSIKEVLDLPEFEISYCKTDDMRADIFTKALVPAKWDNAIALLKMRLIPADTADALPRAAAKLSPTPAPNEAVPKAGPPTTLPKTPKGSTKSPSTTTTGAPACAASAPVSAGLEREVFNRCMLGKEPRSSMLGNLPSDALSSVGRRVRECGQNLKVRFSNSFNAPPCAAARPCAAAPPSAGQCGKPKSSARGWVPLPTC